MRRRLRVVEAACLLVSIRLLIGVVPFRWLVRLFLWAPRRRQRSDADRSVVITNVQRAIASAAVRAPGAFVCFPRAAAAQAMLRRRGVESTLYYGAAILDEQRLTAHVWLQCQAVGVVGHEDASRFHVVATYAAARRA